MPQQDLHHIISSQILLLSKPENNSSPPSITQNFLELYHFQHQRNPAYRKYCDSLISSPPQQITDIPSLPTDSFKNIINPTSLTTSEIKNTFLTSGTTSEIKGKHHFSTTSTYETSIISGWKYCQLPEFHQTLILTPSPDESPNSSLSHMMGTLNHEFNLNATFVLSEGKLDLDTILKHIEQNTPLTLLGTALAFLQLFETLPAPVNLPEGSWALETGGYKGSDRSLTKDELYQLFQTSLGIPPHLIWNEYSMTELSSQFYTRGLGNPHTAPPWTYIKVINPETNLPVSPGEIGYLIIYDLANIDSVMAIRTQDLAIYHHSQSFTLIGRDPSALPRGCSRSL